MSVLISCVMPTTASRAKYIPSAIRCWAEQTHTNKELIIVSEDDISHLVPDDPRIRFVKCSQQDTLGRKRNLGNAAAKGGLIAHWDDDDWSYPGRLEECASGFVSYMIALVGYEQITYFREDIKVAYRSRSHFVPGSTFMYLKTFWERNKFDEHLTTGEDTQFVRGLSRDSARVMLGHNKMIAREHGENTLPRNFQENSWDVIGAANTERLLNSQPRTKVALALLSWNRRDVTIENLEALKQEAQRLRCYNFDPHVVICDNGSSDGTPNLLKKQKGVKVILNKKNLGSAVARNQIIDHAIEIDAEYILFVDCDITVIPGSTLEMLLWFRNHGGASLGMNSGKWTSEPEKATTWCPQIEDVWVAPFVCLTQYGLFPVSILKQFRFDEHYGPGWGYEDNDLAMQIQDKTGVLNYTFNKNLYLHRHISSSIALMEADGIDAHKNVMDRANYIMKKWGNKPVFKPMIEHILAVIEQKKLVPKTTFKVAEKEMAAE